MIDLRKVYDQNNACIKSRNLLKLMLEDFYPDNQKEIDTILAIYDMEYHIDIAKDENFYESKLKKWVYTQTLKDEYGITEYDACTGFKAWNNFYHNKGKIFTTDETFIPVSGNAKDFELRDAEKYGELEIVRFLGFDSEQMTIPNSIDGQRITALGNEAFLGCRYVKKITISEGIETIGHSCFANCKGLESIQLPHSLDAIPAYAFSHCESLNEIMMNNHIIEIGDYAFENCNSLSELILPDSVKVIGDHAFSGCKNLTEIMLGNQVMEIGSYAFLGCQKLQSLVFPDSLKEIDNEAFSSCDSLTQIEFPASITKIDKLLFSHCDRLQDIIFNEGLMEIGTRFYADCSSLQRIILPQSVNSIHIDETSHVYPPNDKVTFYCYAGSFALQYAKKHGYCYADASAVVRL